jgi:hypothetical protein
MRLAAITAAAGVVAVAVGAVGDDDEDDDVDDVVEDDHDENREDDNQDGESNAPGAELRLLAKGHPTLIDPKIEVACMIRYRESSWPTNVRGVSSCQF